MLITDHHFFKYRFGQIWILLHGSVELHCGCTCNFYLGFSINFLLLYFYIGIVASIITSYLLMFTVIGKMKKSTSMNCIYFSSPNTGMFSRKGNKCQVKLFQMTSVRSSVQCFLFYRNTFEEPLIMIYSILDFVIELQVHKCISYL